jgi:hypothetical protein
MQRTNLTLTAAGLAGRRRPRALVEQVVKVVKQFSTGRSQHDDIALVGFGRTCKSATRKHTEQQMKDQFRTMAG